ncbi:MAG: phosphotransferase [Micromonosporaceae bacterium]
MRFGVAMDHRVELLGYSEADALAGVCYSFAGGEALGLKTPDDLLADASNDGWRTVIKEIFSPTASNWYAVRSDVSELRTHFRNELEIHLDRCFGLTSRCPACLAHGDLHGGNVVVDHLDRAYFIDYRNAGVAPRLIDFAALQATARFSHVDSFRPARGWPKNATSALVEAIAATVRKEERVLGRRLVNGERWIEVAAELDRARLANFSESDPPEALWTNFAYCLSLFRFTHMQWYRKLRLLAWFSALTAAAEKSG